jgi:hypothetical protein
MFAVVFVHFITISYYMVFMTVKQDVNKIESLLVMLVVELAMNLAF